MLEWFVLGSGWGIFLIQQIYRLGKITARLSSLEDEVKWIRNYLLTQNTDVDCLKERSPVELNRDIKEILPSNWLNKLKNIKINKTNSTTPYDCVIQLSNNYGLVNLKKEAEKMNINYNLFLISSGIYLYENE